VTENLKAPIASVALANTRTGDRVRITLLDCGIASRRLIGMGLIPGASLEIVSCTGNGSVVVALKDQRIGLDASMARQIQVIDAKLSQTLLTSLTMNSKDTKAAAGENPDVAPVKLRDIPVSAVGRVVGYDPAARSYKRKLLAMGLTPGVEFIVTRRAPLGDPIEIRVRGFQLSLRKDEADAMLVELA
jgi:ferrous iron transport protein A